MSRTTRKVKDSLGRDGHGLGWRYYQREEGWARKLTRRQYRRQVAKAMARGEYDVMPLYPSTEGWISW